MGRTHPTYCERCGKVADWGDVGGSGSTRECTCKPRYKVIPMEAWEMIEPVITTHLRELQMDTDEDNALLAEIREMWEVVVNDGRVGVPSR